MLTLNKIIWKPLKNILILLLVVSSTLAISIYFIGDYDPVKLSLDLISENNRDQALDVIDYSIENKHGNQEKLQSLREEYRYGTYEISKDLLYHGCVKGEAFNFYSGLGCVATDLCIVGDVRDLTKQTYNYATGEKVDYIVAGLSAIGVGTTVLELTGVGAAADAGISVIKTTIKYCAKVIRKIPDSVLLIIKNGKKLSPSQYGKLWDLFKSTRFSIPNFTSILSNLKMLGSLENAAKIVKTGRTGGVIFIKQTGEAGIKTFEYFKRYRLSEVFSMCIKKNPKAALGITKFHTLLHSIKFFKNHGTVKAFLLLILIPAYIIASTILMIGGVLLPIFVLAALSTYLLWSCSCSKKVKLLRISKKGVLKNKSVEFKAT